MPEVRQEVLDAFRMMWGLYPEPVMLIHAGREIIAMNKRAESLGISLGIKCHTLYPSDKPCPGCLANKALRRGAAERKAAYSERQKRFMDGFWVPVDGEKDLYVHFGNDITELVRPELMPECEFAS